MSTPQLQQLRAKAEQGQPESQFLMSQICRQNRDIEGMVHWLRLACSKQLPDALDALGHCYEKGAGLPQDFLSALSHYDRAIEKASVSAAYHKAELLYKSQRGPSNEDMIQSLLLSAADSDFMPALRAIGYLAIQQSTSREMGMNCLRRAARLGDPVSGFNLAWCLLQNGGNEQEAKYHLQQAASVHYPFAESLMARLQNVQTSQPDGIEKLNLDSSFALYPEAKPTDHEDLHTDPAVNMFAEVLNTADCAYLMFLSRPHLRRANVINPGSQKDGMVSEVRTSMSTYIPFGLVDIIARCVELKIIRKTGEDLAHSEPMSILYYTPGQFYRPHVDYFDPKLTVSKELLEDGGQRTASAVTYLSAPAKGGGTSFPRLDLSVPAVAGSTLWFRNCFADGGVDDRSLHAGDPVEQGEKWVVTKWFREKPTRYLEF